MNLFLALLATVPLRIAVLGDRTGTPNHDEFLVATASMLLMHPDVILTVGDFVEGDGDVQTAVEDWLLVRPVLDELEAAAPVVYVPGNNDIWNDETAEYWLQYTGTEPDRIEEVRGIRFVVWNSSIGNKMDLEDLQEIETMLEEIENGDRWIFVTHKPFWFMTDQDPKILDEFYLMMEEKVPLAVIGGHIHLFASERRNGILYVSAGPSGSGSALREPDPFTGNLTQLGWLTVWPDSVAYTVIDCRGIYPEDVNTGREMQLSNLYRRNLIQCRPLDPEYESMNLTLIPQEDKTREITLRIDPGNWGLRPESVTVLLEDTVRLNFTQNPSGTIYPAPSFEVELEYGERDRDLQFSWTPQVMRRINAFRGSAVIDGAISDGEYRVDPQRGFADDSGDPSAFDVYFTACTDGERLCLAMSRTQTREGCCGFILAAADGGYIWVRVFDDSSVEALRVSDSWETEALEGGFETASGEHAVEVALNLEEIAVDDGEAALHVYRSMADDLGTWVYPISMSRSTMGSVWLETMPIDR